MHNHVTLHGPKNSLAHTLTHLRQRLLPFRGHLEKSFRVPKWEKQKRNANTIRVHATHTHSLKSLPKVACAS